MPVPADIYKNDIDFTLLALQYPNFAKKLKRNGQLDFSDPESVLLLTKALLDRDFQLAIDLPTDRLCPPVPNRFNYINYIQQLLNSTQDSCSEEHDVDRRVVGIDVGTGASAIYPLLACRQNPAWVFLATEIDVKSREYALKNIASNRLSSRIRIVGNPVPDGDIVPWHEFAQFDQTIDFLMTNPPFYEDEADMLNLATQKSRPPNSICTGAPTEMIYPGGEVGFVSRIFHESRLDNHRQHAIRWYTSTLGKFSSATTLIELLRAHDCHNYAITEFVQGHKTRRWCIAWSFGAWRPSIDVARGTSAIEKRLLPWPTAFEFEIEGTSLRKVRGSIQKQISVLTQVAFDESSGVGRSVYGDVWSRKARRRQQQQEKTVAETRESEAQQKQQSSQKINENDKTDEKDQRATGSTPNQQPSNLSSSLFIFRITVQPDTPNLSAAHTYRPPTSTISNKNETETENIPNDIIENIIEARGRTILTIRWLHGTDARTFESFCSWIKRGVMLIHSRTDSRID